MSMGVREYRIRGIHAAAALSMALTCASNAMADEILWIAPTGGSFSDPMNWAGGQTPGTFDDVVFDLGEWHAALASLGVTSLTLSSEAGHA